MGRENDTIVIFLKGAGTRRKAIAINGIRFKANMIPQLILTKSCQGLTYGVYALFAIRITLQAYQFFLKCNHLILNGIDVANHFLLFSHDTLFTEAGFPPFHKRKL